MTLQEKFDDIRAEAYEQGIEQGIEQGELSLAARLVASGAIAPDVAAEQLGLTPEEFERVVTELEAPVS